MQFPFLYLLSLFLGGTLMKRVETTTWEHLPISSCTRKLFTDNLNPIDLGILWSFHPTFHVNVTRHPKCCCWPHTSLPFCLRPTTLPPTQPLQLTFAVSACIELRSCTYLYAILFLSTCVTYLKPLRASFSTSNCIPMSQLHILIIL